jgi:hypothetical protein
METPVMPRLARVPVGAILLLHLRHELLYEEILIAHFAIFGVDVEGVSGAGRQNHEVANLAFAAQF